MNNNTLRPAGHGHRPNRPPQALLDQNRIIRQQEAARIPERMLDLQANQPLPLNGRLIQPAINSSDSNDDGTLLIDEIFNGISINLNNGNRPQAIEPERRILLPMDQWPPTSRFI